MVAIQSILASGLKRIKMNNPWYNVVTILSILNNIMMLAFVVIFAINKWKLPLWLMCTFVGIMAICLLLIIVVPPDRKNNEHSSENQSKND